jgi:hypothetical protein
MSHDEITDAIAARLPGAVTRARAANVLRALSQAGYEVVPRRDPQPQRQDSLDDQLRDVQAAANRMGCYDAADWIKAGLKP